MTNTFYEVEYYKCLLFSETCEDDEFQILRADPEVKSFLRSKKDVETPYEKIVAHEDFPENLEGAALSVWQVVRSILAEDPYLFDFPEVIPVSDFANAMIAYAAGFSRSEEVVTTVFNYIEDHLNGEWGPLLVGLAESDNEPLLQYFFEVHLEDEPSDTVYYKEWLRIAKDVALDESVQNYLNSI